MKKLLNIATRSHFLGTCCLVVFGFLAGPVQANSDLTPHTAEYKVKISVVSGRLKTELKATESGYIATHQIAPTGFSKILAHGEISEVSEFASTDDGVIPIAYRSNDTLSRDKERANIRFDWDTNEASGTVNEKEIVSIMEGLSHDRVSIQYALMHDMLNGGLDEQYRMFEIDKMRTVSVRSVGEKKVKVRAGKFTAIGIQHQAENSTRTTTFWCVEELDYLPVIIEQHRKGKLKVKATLRKYTPVRENELTSSE